MPSTERTTATRAHRAVLLAALLTAGLAACSDGSDEAGPADASASTITIVAESAPSTATPGASDALSSTDAEGSTAIDTAQLAEQLPATPAAALTQPEIDALLWMREEEKLAHDVYVTLGDAWDLKIFTNISASEQTHTDAVLTLLDHYGIADPSEGKAIGEFRDPAIQALHDELLATGLQSATKALEVGATIEDLDIVDLQQRATATADINLVYANLELGSRNHLRAFVSNLETQGVTYVPQHLSPQAYQAIISSEMERGNAAR